MAPQVLFIYNEHLATEGLLGEAFTECGYDVATFSVVPAERVDDPVATWTFPDPTRYDVIVPLGARWPVYDEALRQTWVGAEMQMLRDAADAGVPTLGVCFGGQLLAQAFGGSVARSATPEIGWYEVTSDDESLIPGGRWFEWHFDTWTLPPGATEIARTANCVAGLRARSGARRCSSTPKSITICSTYGWPTTAMERSQASASAMTNYVRLQRNSRADAARRIRGLVRGFLSRVAHQPCPS